MSWSTYKEWQQQDWDRAHKEQDESALTGTGLAGHLATLKMEEFVKPSSSVLCIGVGTGDWVRELREITHQIVSLDVSKEAGKNIPGKFYTDPREFGSSVFDAAMSLWVAPHMTNHDLEDQLKHVIRALKPTGVFGIHYKEPYHNEAVVDNREGSVDEWRVAFQAKMLRRRKHFMDMVHWAGGIAEVVLERPSPFHETTEVSAHIRRAV